MRGRRLTWDAREVVQHGMNADRVELSLDDEWLACDRIVAVLAKTGQQAFRVEASRGFFIPSALMEETGPLRMCLIGYAGDSVRIVTAKEAAPLVVVESGETGGTDPAPEQPDLWEQLMEEVRKATEGAKTAAQSATRAEADLRAAAERGDFDGEDGKTPVRGVDYWTPEDRKPIEDATDAALTSAGKADAAAEKASVGEAERVNAETARAEAEQARAIAETGRVEAEATRAANESERAETFNSNLVSWNSKVDAACKKATDTASKAAQDAKTATDAAIAQTQEATNAAVAKADKATASATTAANKAEAAVSKLPLPLGNTLKGEKESTMVNVHDAFPAPLVETKVMGHSNQITTTGKNLLGGTRYVSGYNIRGFKNILKPNTQYTYSCSGITDGKAAFRLLALNAQQSKEIGLTVGYIKNASETFTTPENIGEFEELYLGGNYNDAGKNCINNFFQIEEGAKATSYEPYTGGKPSPSPEYPQEITNLTKAELVITGKNLINPNRLAQIDSSYYQAEDGQLKVISSHNAAWKDVPIYGTLQAGTYTLSGDNIEIRDTALNQIVNSMSTQVKQFTLNNPTSIKMKVGYGWPKYPVITKAQLEVGSKATTYEPHKSKSTPIDLKGNELCSLPNGVKDEVVIDAEGNVSLIKRTKQHTWHCQAIHIGTAKNYAMETVGDIGPNYSGLVADKAINATNGQIGTCYVNQRMIYVVVPESMTTKEQANQLYGGMKVIYQLAEPQTIPLGKVELPALPESTSNIWNNGNIPANVYINYLKDVNIAFADLESKLTQAVVATAANL